MTTKNKLEWITAVATVVIALTGIVFSLDQACRTRRHNMLSVTPNLSFEYDASLEPDIHFSVTNTGIGPAIIKEFTVYVDNNPMKDENCGLDAALKSDAGFPDIKIKRTCPPKNGMYLPAGNKIVFMSTIGKKINEKQRQQFDNFIKTRFNVRIKYESIYKEKYEKTWLVNTLK